MKAKTKRSLGHGEERSAVRRTSLSIGIFHRQTSLVYALSNNHRLEVSGIALTLKRADHLSPIASPFMGSDPRKPLLSLLVLAGNHSLDPRRSNH